MTSKSSRRLHYYFVCIMVATAVQGGFVHPPPAAKRFDERPLPLTMSSMESPPLSAVGAASADGNNKTPLFYMIVDYDGTCTKQDTTALLPRLASTLQQESKKEQRQRLATFDELEADFLQRYSTTMAQVLGQQKESPSSLLQALQALDEQSTIVTRRVSASRVLQGLEDRTSEEVQTALTTEYCNDVELHEHCLSVLKYLHGQLHWQLGVLSINWCRPLIEATLIDPIRESSSDAGEATSTEAAAKKEVFLWSNHVETDGVVKLHIPGAAEKLERISALKQEKASSSSMIIYVGDSVTDLPALLHADVGILFTPSSHSSVVQFLKCHAGADVSVVPLTEWKSDLKNVLFRTNTWLDIQAFCDRIHLSDKRN